MRSRQTVLCCVLLLSLFALGCGLLVRVAPDPIRADAPTSVFSALRAKAAIEWIARTPHPSGTPAAKSVRDHVTAELKRIGLSPEEHEAIEVLPGRTTSHLAGRVDNITATIPGRDSTGQVILVAHTDSVETGPGASDDGLGVASLLEIARIVHDGPPLRNDVVLLFTDAEEQGQLGSRSFVRDVPRSVRDHSVVVNLDARGTGGRAVMFETGDHSSAMVRALGGHAPVTTSLADEVYRLLPNETDFTNLRNAGMTGLNFAVIGGSARYHGPTDDLAHVDTGTLQDLGDTTLSAVRSLAATDLGRATRAGESTWFNLGPLLIRYPSMAVLPLALAAAVALAAATWTARRRGALRLRPVLRAAATFPLTLVAAAALGWAAWQALLLVRPEYQHFALGDPYRTGPAVAGLLLLAAAVTWAWAVWTARTATALEAAAGTLVWPALLAVVTAVVLPGAAYVFTWTALGGAAGLALAALTAERSPWRTVALTASALPGIAVTAPLVALLFPALGLASAAAPTALAALLAAVVLLPLAGRVSAARIRPALAAAIAATLLGAILVGGNAAVDTTDAEHPRPVSLMYALDADHDRAYWVSEDADPQPWVSHYTGDRRTDTLESWSPALAAPPGGLLAGRAPVAPVSRPVVRTLSSQRAGTVRTLRLSVRPESGTPTLLALYVDTRTTEVIRADLADAPDGTGRLAGGVNRPYAGAGWKWGILFVAPPSKGYEITLTVRDTGRPVRLLAMTEDAGLPEPALDRPRPDRLTWIHGSAGISFTSRAYKI
jgi:hypothetical protein